MDLKSMQLALQQIAEEKGLDIAKVLETVEMAIAAAYKKDYGKRGQIVRASFDAKTGAISFRQIKIVVDESMLKTEKEIAEEEQRKLAEAEAALAEGRRRPRKLEDEDDEPMAEGQERKVRFNPEKHIMLDEAKKIKKDTAVDDEIEFSLESHIDYGRIAAQTAKQVIIQRIREAERASIFSEFKAKEGTIVSGIVQRIEGHAIFVDIGRTIAILPPEEQIPFERYRVGERVKCLVFAVQENPRGPGIFLSRSHPKLIFKLFEVEVPEVASGAVELRSIAREAGSRSKIAVISHEEGVDPVGSLVGQKGVRVMAVINELGGEKVDIIEWADDPATFIGNALSPAKVVNVDLDSARREARVIVHSDELSLAIGKRGQNVRLAAKLTGWKIDLRSDTKPNAPADLSAQALASAEVSTEQEKSAVPPAASPEESISDEAVKKPETEPEEKKKEEKKKEKKKEEQPTDEKPARKKRKSKKSE